MTSQLTFKITEQCPACGASLDRSLDIYDIGRTRVRRCACSHVFLNPALDDASQIAIYQSSEVLKEINPALEEYYEYDTLNPACITYKEYALMLEQAENAVSGRKLLEVGCGDGAFVKAAKARGWDVTGLDPGRQSIENLQRAGINAVLGDYLGFSSEGRFDCIVMRDLIEHPQNPLSFVDKTSKLLNPNGILILVCPYYPNLLSILAGVFYKLGIKGPIKKMYMVEHVSYFNLKSLAALLARQNFKIEKFSKTETDLARYKFPALTLAVLRVMFLFAKVLGLGNRISVVARKVS